MLVLSSSHVADACFRAERRPSEECGSGKRFCQSTEGNNNVMSINTSVIKMWNLFFKLDPSLIYLCFFQALNKSKKAQVSLPGHHGYLIQ